MAAEPTLAELVNRFLEDCPPDVEMEWAPGPRKADTAARRGLEAMATDLVAASERVRSRPPG